MPAIDNVNFIAPGDAANPGLQSYKRQAVRIGPWGHFVWRGYITLTNAAVASADILTPSEEKAYGNQTSLIIPANSLIYRTAFRVLNAITLSGTGAATGKLKLATALAAATATLYAESAAASSSVIAASASWVETVNATPVTIGSSDLTYKLYGTDGAAGASAASCNMAVASSGKVLVEIAGMIRAPYPTADEIGVAATTYADATVSY